MNRLTLPIVAAIGFLGACGTTPKVPSGINASQVVAGLQTACNIQVSFAVAIELVKTFVPGVDVADDFFKQICSAIIRPGELKKLRGSQVTGSFRGAFVRATIL
jgi:hypothetical protein